MRNSPSSESLSWRRGFGRHGRSDLRESSTGVTNADRRPPAGDARACRNVTTAVPVNSRDLAKMTGPSSHPLPAPPSGTDPHPHEMRSVPLLVQRAFRTPGAALAGLRRMLAGRPAVRFVSTSRRWTWAFPSGTATLHSVLERSPRPGRFQLSTGPARRSRSGFRHR